MKRTIDDFAFAIDLLESLINNDSSQDTTLVVCSNKKAFLRQISPPILTPLPQEIPASQEDIEEDEAPQSPKPHRLLTPTLGLLASTRAVKTAFCPSVKALRAYLSSYTVPARSISQTKTGNSSSRLIIVDLVLLHRATSELSVQGLSRTFACAVEAAARNGTDLRLVECKNFHDVDDPNRGYSLWEVQAPLLSGSVRLRADGANWAGRAINVKTIASRWFEFEQRKTEVARVDVQEEDEEMLV
jgi:hypothetical protein